MGKLLRLFFSRFTLIFFSILLQIALAVAVTVYFSAYFQIATVLSAALMVLGLLIIINRDMECDAKLPWSILVAIAPIVGVVLYLCISHNYASRRERKMFVKLPQLKLADNHPNAPAKYLGQIKYLQNMGAPVFSDTDTTYFRCGEEFFADLVVELEKAQRFIFMEYFIVEHGKMFDTILEVLKRKIAQGVEVRLLYDDVGSLPHVKQSFCKDMQKLGINCVRFAKLRPIVSAVYNNRDHRKITVIDGKVGYMGGINLADEYINHTHPFGYWKDTALRLNGNAVANLCIMFLQMFNMSTQQTEDFERYLVHNQQTMLPNKGLVAPFGDGPRPIYKEHIAKNVYLNLINQAVHELYITTPYLILDESLTQALCRAALRGVDVHIIIPGVPDKKSVYALTKHDCKKLVSAGVKIYKFTAGFIHAKSIIADGVAGVVGTINLDSRSLIHHYECGVYMFDTAAIGQLHADLVATTQQSELQVSAPGLSIGEKLICLVGNVFRPLL